MKKSTAGFLVGAAAILAWFFRGKIVGVTFVRPITLKMKKGQCGIAEEPDPVELHWLRDDKIRWEISNPAGTGCSGQPEVCIGNWRLNGVPTDAPPVTNPNGLCRQVRQGGPSKHILANIDFNAPLGYYEYDVLVDNVVVQDPIVKLTL